MRERLLDWGIYGLCSAIGVLAFLYPFIAPALRESAMGQAHANDAPLTLTVLVSLCFLALLLQVQRQAVNAKFVALLGVLVSMNAVLRFLEIIIPIPGGFSPIFFLIVLTGYVYGGRFGFLMGAMTLVVSALITGAMGPWLPFQMFTVSWLGLSAPLCRPVVRLLGGPGRRSEILLLAVFAGLWGLIYGLIMNIWFWPFASGPADQYWQPGIGLGDTLRRYAVFYVTTSLLWDVLRAVGNVLFVFVFGAPTLRALRRFKRRFAYSYQPASPPTGSGIQQ